jgi:hypothetical protein
MQAPVKVSRLRKITEVTVAMQPCQPQNRHLRFSGPWLFHGIDQPRKDAPRNHVPVKQGTKKHFMPVRGITSKASPFPISLDLIIVPSLRWLCLKLLEPTLFCYFSAPRF